MPDPVGQTLTDRYHLLTKLGEGSMASVYRAEDRVRGCLVTAKVMKPHQLGDAVALERFCREAESLMRAAVSRPACSSARVATGFRPCHRTAPALSST